MKRFLVPTALTAAVLFPQLSATAYGVDFYVTGVYGSGERLGALIELDGETKSVKAGEIVGGVPIAAVVPEGVEVEVDGERYLVPLGRGSAAKLPKTRLEPQRQVKLAPLKELVPELRVVEQSLRDETDEPKLHVAVAEALGLPSEARIIAIRKQEFDGPLDALRQIRKSLARGELPQVTVEGVPNMHRVYIEPSDAGITR